MILRLRFHEDARAEIRTSAEWYERKQQALGNEFMSALNARLVQLCGTPGMGVPIPGIALSAPVQRVFLARFPYTVVFVKTEEEIRVIAVAHAKRRPGYWRGRL